MAHSFSLFFSRAFGRHCARFLLALAVVFALSLPARAEDHELLVTWENPSPSIGGLKRIAGDADNWTFTVKLEEGLEWVRGPQWTYPQSGADEDWGAFSGGADGADSLSWSSPLSGGNFRVGVTGRIRRTGGGGGGKGGPAEEKEVDSAWTGEVDDVWDWTPEPTLPSGQLIASNLSVRAGDVVNLTVTGIGAIYDSDTRTNLAGKTEIKREGSFLTYTWSSGGQGRLFADVNSVGSNSWTAPTNVPLEGKTFTIICRLDDNYPVGATGVKEPDTGTRNDEAGAQMSIAIKVSPRPCGQFKHDSWTPATEVKWNINAEGYPIPLTPQVTENVKWEDACEPSNNRAPVPETFAYPPALGENDIVISEGGVFYRRVRFQAQSNHGGPPSPILESRRPFGRVWQPSPELSGGTMTAIVEGTVLKPGESFTLAVSHVTDLDTWMRNGVTRQETDEVTYQWSASSGSFIGGTTASSAQWKAPPLAEVPAGAQGLNVTIICTIKDKWDGEATGVAAPDSGTRNDASALTRTASLQVLRAPCGRWEHKSWKAGAITWRTDSNGDPEPIAPKDAIETIQWVDECAGTTKPDEERSVPYTLVSDQAVEIEEIWYREVKYRAYSTCPEGESTPAAADEPLTDRRALPRHWSVPGALDAGLMNIALSGEGTAGLPTPPVATPASTTTLRLPINGGVALSVSGAKDTDSYTYWHVPEKTDDDTIKYKWSVTDEEGNKTELGTAATASWSSDAAGTYTLIGEVDDASSVDEEGAKESGVTPPDQGERNDDEVIYIVVVTAVAREWDADQPIGRDWKRDANGGAIAPDADGNRETIENGLMLAPQDQRKRNVAGQPLPAQGVAGTDYRPEEIFIRPGQELDCQVQEATDWDHWKLELGSAPAGKRFSPPYQDWEKDTVKYQWSATGPQTGTFADANKAATKWTAPRSGNGEEVAGTYVLTCTISDAWDEGASGVAAPATGTRNDGDIVRTVEVTIRESDSWAELGVFASDAAGEPNDEEAQGAVGGKLWAQLKLTVGTNQQLAPLQTGVTVRVEETDSLHAEQTAPLPYFDTALSLTQGWEYLRDRDAQGALLPEAQWQWVAGGNPSEVKDYEMQYRQRFSWDSTKKPLGHNGEHLVSLVGANALLRFVKLNGESYESGPQSRNIDAQNLVITGVSTSNGTEDYFKFDPAAEAESDLKQPNIKFTIKDEGDSHRYKWRVRVRSTDRDDDWQDSILISGVADDAKDITAKINDPGATGQTQVSDMSSNAGTDPTAYAPLKEWGTYTFDISVEEVDDKGNSLGDAESYRSKRLFIPRETPDGSGRGHGGDIVRNEDGSESYFVHYYFHDNSTPALSPDTEVSSMKIEMLPPDLGTPIASDEGSWGKKLEVGYYDKLLHTFAPGTRPPGTTITLFTAQDTHASKYRDHKNKRSLVKNDQEKNIVIESVEWEAVYSDSPLDDNPADMGGGKRIFPGKISPTDAKDRQKVRVKAKVLPAKAGIKVYFQGFDVDEPGTDAKPIDTDGSPSGGDNRSFTSGFRTIKSPVDSFKEGTTDAQGVVEIEYGVSFKPGDNYRVAAASSSDELKKLNVKWDDTGNNEMFVPGTKAQVTKFSGKITETLTVWRRLHVEVDSMGPVVGNTVIGQMDVDDNGDGTSACTTDQNLDDNSAEPGRFEDGVLTDSTGRQFTVISNTGVTDEKPVNNNFKVVVRNIVGGETEVTPTIGSFELVDDDPTDGGADGEDVPEPNTDLLAEKLRPAYIEVKLDGDEFGWNQNNVPFVLNLPSDRIVDLEDVAQQSRQSVSRQDFWTTHCLGAFQPPTNDDWDPNSRYDEQGKWIGGDGAFQGISSRKTAFVCSQSQLEKRSASPSQQAHTLLHEVGHNFGLDHEDGDGEGPNRGVMRRVTDGNFTFLSLAKIRAVGYPSR